MDDFERNCVSDDQNSWEIRRWVSKSVSQTVVICRRERKTEVLLATKHARRLLEDNGSSIDFNAFVMKDEQMTLTSFNGTWYSQHKDHHQRWWGLNFFLVPCLRLLCSIRGNTSTTTQMDISTKISLVSANSIDSIRSNMTIMLPIVRVRDILWL